MTKEEAIEELDGFFDEFKAFLKEFKVVTGAIAFIMALAVNDLIKSFVDDVVMPSFRIFIPEQEISELVWVIDGATIKIGSFLAAFIQFLIIAIVIFVGVHYILKWEVEKIT